MRINVYSQELTPEVSVVSKIDTSGIVFRGVRFVFHSHPNLHHTSHDDDRSAVTFWIPEEKSHTFTSAMLAQLFAKASDLVREQMPQLGE